MSEPVKYQILVTIEGPEELAGITRDFLHKEVERLTFYRDPSVSASVELAPPDGWPWAP